MADGMPRCPDCRDTGNDLLTPVVLAYLLFNHAENPPVGLKQLRHSSRRGTGHLAVIHPEIPFRRRHDDPGTWKRRTSFRRHEPRHVVAVKMRDDHDIDRIWINR